MGLQRRIRLFVSDRGPGGEGQALAEFAIAFPLQLFITFGIMQLILLYVSTLVVNYAAFRACRAALVGEDPRLAAAVVLSPLAGTHIAASDKSSSPKQTIPGWGEIHNSDTAYAKTLAYEVEAKGAEEEKSLTVVVEFDQELVFPVVDALFATFFRAKDAGETQTVFGELDQGFASGDYLSRSSIYDPETGKFTRPRVREVDGVNHLVIARQCTMYRQYAANYKDGGEIDIGKKK